MLCRRQMLEELFSWDTEDQGRRGRPERHQLPGAVMVAELGLRLRMQGMEG